MNAAQGDDTKDLKPVILELISQKYLLGLVNEVGEKSIWNSTRANTKHLKLTHGFTNNITARLLCPIDHLQAFDADPSEFVLS